MSTEERYYCMEKYLSGRSIMDLKEEIRKVAYELYEKSGRREGCEFGNWLEAEKIVLARRAQEEKGEKVKTPAATHQGRKTPVRARASGAEAHDKEPGAAKDRKKTRAKKTGPKKAARAAK
jgi:hypothetical protein